MLDEAVTTARAAAEHLGCPIGAIANSLIFETFRAASVGMREQLKETEGGVPLLIMTSGAHRVDMSKVGEQLGVQLRRGSPAFVREHTDQPIGGVAPVGHTKPIRTRASSFSSFPLLLVTPDAQPGRTRRLGAGGIAPLAPGEW